MKGKLRLSGLMMVIALLCFLLALPFQCRTPQGELYRRRADRLGELAAECRAAERQARAKGKTQEAEQFRAQTERLEQEGWVCRKASYREWKWPELMRPRRIP